MKTKSARPKIKTVTAAECSKFNMVLRGEKEHPVVIQMAPCRMQWVGMGWVNEGPASFDDLLKYPHVK